MIKIKKIIFFIIKSLLTLTVFLSVVLFFYAAFFYEPALVEKKTIDNQVIKSEELSDIEKEKRLKKEEERRLEKENGDPVKDTLKVLPKLTKGIKEHIKNSSSHYAKYYGSRQKQEDLRIDFFSNITITALSHKLASEFGEDNWEQYAEGTITAECLEAESKKEHEKKYPPMPTWDELTPVQQENWLRNWHRYEKCVKCGHTADSHNEHHECLEAGCECKRFVPSGSVV